MACICMNLLYPRPLLYGPNVHVELQVCLFCSGLPLHCHTGLQLCWVSIFTCTMHSFFLVQLVACTGVANEPRAWSAPEFCSKVWEECLTARCYGMKLLQTSQQVASCGSSGWILRGSFLHTMGHDSYYEWGGGGWEPANCRLQNAICWCSWKMRTRNIHARSLPIEQNSWQK